MPHFIPPSAARHRLRLNYHHRHHRTYRTQLPQQCLAHPPGSKKQSSSLRKRAVLLLPSPSPVKYLSNMQRVGSYLITSEIAGQLPELANYKMGLLTLFIQHTSCALSLNENWDSDVRLDMSDALDRIVPEDRKNEGIYRHDSEGSDDMPAHVKSALVGASVTVPITDGQLALGTWQGMAPYPERDLRADRGLEKQGFGIWSFDGRDTLGVLSRPSMAS